jgi:hypothetical protein
MLPFSSNIYVASEILQILCLHLYWIDCKMGKHTFPVSLGLQLVKSRIILKNTLMKFASNSMLIFYSFELITQSINYLKGFYKVEIIPQ